MDNDSFVLALGSSKTYTNSKISELPVPFKVKSAVQTVADLPATGNTAGDVRKVIQDNNREYYWDGSAWNVFGPDNGEVFIATYGTTTYSEISAAITAGKAVFCKYDTSTVDYWLPLIDETDPGTASGKYIFAKSSIITNDGITVLEGVAASLSKATNTWDPVHTGSFSLSVLECIIMPSASAEYSGKVVQYVGTTDSTYTKGYFYECKESSGTYSWEQTEPDGRYRQVSEPLYPSNGGN